MGIFALYHRWIYPYPRGVLPFFVWNEGIGSKGIVSVRGISEPVHIAVYTMNGMLVQEMDADRNISFSLPAGLYIVKANGTAAKVAVSR